MLSAKGKSERTIKETDVVSPKVHPSRSRPLSNTIALSLSLTHTQTIPISYTISHTRTLSLSRSLPRLLSISYTMSLSLFNAPTILLLHLSLNFWRQYFSSSSFRRWLCAALPKLFISSSSRKSLKGNKIQLVSQPPPFPEYALSKETKKYFFGSRPLIPPNCVASLST